MLYKQEHFLNTLYSANLAYIYPRYTVKDMVHYKLIYFSFRGRGELSRLILHYAQVPFEDVRIERSEWLTYKSSKLYTIHQLAHSGYIKLIFIALSRNAIRPGARFGSGR